MVSHYFRGLDPTSNTVDNHLDHPLTEEDIRQAGEIAGFVGDLFIEAGSAPVTQWQVVVKALRLHGYAIVDRESDDET